MQALSSRRSLGRALVPSIVSASKSARTKKARRLSETGPIELGGRRGGSDWVE